MNAPWYAVQCKGGQDQRAELELGRQGYDVFRPKLVVRKRSGTRLESYFPRYLFIRLGTGVRSFAPVRSTRGVLRMVGWGNVTPTVPNELIAALRDRTDELGCIVLDTGRFSVNQAVRIIDGPFHDLIGRFARCSADERVVVLLNILQQEQAVAFPADMVEPA